MLEHELACLANVSRKVRLTFRRGDRAASEQFRNLRTVAIEVGVRKAVSLHQVAAVFTTTPGGAASETAGIARGIERHIWNELQRLLEIIDRDLWDRLLPHCKPMTYCAFHKRVTRRIAYPDHRGLSRA